MSQSAYPELDDSETRGHPVKVMDRFGIIPSATFGGFTTGLLIPLGVIYGLAGPIRAFAKDAEVFESYASLLPVLLWVAWWVVIAALIGGVIGLAFGALITRGFSFNSAIEASLALVVAGALVSTVFYLVLGFVGAIGGIAGGVVAVLVMTVYNRVERPDPLPS